VRSADWLLAYGVQNVFNVALTLDCVCEGHHPTTPVICFIDQSKIDNARYNMMTLGNMREHGVRSLAVSCGRCGAIIRRCWTWKLFADDVTVPSFGPRMVCTTCGAIGADARPNWNERAPASLFGRNS